MISELASMPPPSSRTNKIRAGTKGFTPSALSFPIRVSKPSAAIAMVRDLADQHQALMQHRRQGGCDLIVMAANKRGLTASYAGKVTKGVLKRSHVSVVVVPAPL